MVGELLPEKWSWTTLEAVQDPRGRAIVSGPFGSNIGSRFFVPSGIPVIRGNNLTTDLTRFHDDGFVFVTEEKARELAGCHAKPGDLVFTAAGSLGQVGLIPSHATYHTYVISNKQMRARLNRELVDELFAFYWFSSPQMVQYIQQRNTGSSVPLINLSILRSLPLPLPPLAEQRAIASILGALDDKIEFNRRTNETLEAIARALFTSWFVDFDPVRAKMEGRQPVGMDAETAAMFPDALEGSALGDIPQGWTGRKMSDSCTTQYGYTASALSLPVGPHFLRITDMNKEPWIEWQTVPYCAISSGDLPRYKLAIGDVLVSRMADPGKAAIVEEDVESVFASYLIRLKTRDLAMSYYLFYFLRSAQYLDYAQGAMGGSVQANMNAKVIVAADMLLPPTTVRQVFLQHVQPLRQMITSNLQQSRTLAAIRDGLLPKLLSGGIRVRDAERELETAL